MTQNIYDSLITIFPKLFKGKCTKTIFSCGPGWYNLILTACKKLSQNPKLKIQSVKCISGCLHIKVINSTEAEQKYIYYVQAQSLDTCEVCGKMGKLENIDGDYKTLCVIHKRDYPSVV